MLLLPGNTTEKLLNRGDKMSDYIYTANGELVNTDALAHYGVPGMKWGVRRARGHAGPGRYLTKKRQLAGDKRDLEYLNKGGHLSVGLTKKRQAAYDAKDKARLERRIAKNEQRTEKKIKSLETKRDSAITRLKKIANKDIDSYKGFEEGIFTKDGQCILTAKDVSEIKKGLERVRDQKISKIETKYNRQIERAKRIIDDE